MNECSRHSRASQLQVEYESGTLDTGTPLYDGYRGKTRGDGEVEDNHALIEAELGLGSVPTAGRARSDLDLDSMWVCVGVDVDSRYPTFEYKGRRKRCENRIKESGRCQLKIGSIEGREAGQGKRTMVGRLIG